MTIPFLCVGINFILLYLSKVPLGIAMHQQSSGYNNKYPRHQQIQLTGWGHRALAAHQNSFESFSPFAIAVIVANLGMADLYWSNILAITFTISRLLYQIFYLANWDLLRSTVWFIGFLCTGGLFCLPLLRGSQLLTN